MFKTTGESSRHTDSSSNNAQNTGAVDRTNGSQYTSLAWSSNEEARLTSQVHARERNTHR